MKKVYMLLMVLCFFSVASAQIIIFPDANFKARLLTTSSQAGPIDANSDGEIEVSEAMAVNTYLYMDNAGISDLTGIEYFTNLDYLSCMSNQLTSIDLTSNIHLTAIFCDSNQLTSLNVNSLVTLHVVSCSNNLLTSIDVSALINLVQFQCGQNQLTSIFMKNGGAQGSLYFDGNPTLQYICADDYKLPSVQSLLTQYGYTNCTLNSYCSFTPGGTFYAVHGGNRFDGNNNGCDIADVAISNLRLNVANTSGLVGSTICDTTGAYSIPLQAGTYTITPSLPNPSYFTISPTVVNVSFPAQLSPLSQNFCVTANGIHPDLDVTILPIGTARPGFDATYKIIYKNKGNQVQSGVVNVNFDDAVLDLISASPSTSSQAGNTLTWNFTGLQPFETRVIILTFNLNSPVETPAVINGDMLYYTAAITNSGTDETSEDNAFTLYQTVVGSLDPNDKTCLEGTSIAPSMVGKEVHYMIRFENTGTAAAENIVVLDVIDTAKFDISSLLPINGSHSFTTRITSNKVEFLFENINLPFAAGSNDGYVSFKIKTKPTLVVGNTFTNKASIYFDYNAPIITNTATTTVQLLANHDFEFSNYFSVYPNPVNITINIKTKKEIEVSSINIYNTLGQLVLVIPNAEDVSSVDVSSLKTGNYFIKINSDKGSSTAKFIKN